LENKPQKIILSRTDNLGDVILTLPLAGFLKSQIQGIELYFIGKAYTKPLIESCKFIDYFLDKEEILQNPKILEEIKAEAIVFVFPDKSLAQLAAKLNIPLRIGTSHRLFHWLYCNKRVSFSRKKSNLHEAQLNFKLLKPLGFEVLPTFEQIGQWYGLEAKAELPSEVEILLSNSFPKIIIHPKSKGSAREWGLNKYQELIESFSTQNYQFLITGTASEEAQIKQEFPTLLEDTKAINLTGQLTLAQLVSLIARADALIACSTGPLHIAAALGKVAVGLYPPIRPMHPQRWQPIGTNAEVLVLKKECNDCRKQTQCACIRSITVSEVREKVILGVRSESFRGEE
jgi:ADP-heptose:LPS heptosyltransferase